MPALVRTMLVVVPGVLSQDLSQVSIAEDQHVVQALAPQRRDLPGQHPDLVAQHEDLRVLGGVTTRQQRQPAEPPDHEQVDEANEHECRA
jgi:hypothetical protein